MTNNIQTTNRPISRAVKRVLKAQATQDGAGVIARHRTRLVGDDIGLVFLDVFLPPHARLTQPLPQGHTVFAYVADGEVEFGCGSYNSPALLQKRSTAVFDEGDHVSAITDDSSARFLLIAVQPIIPRRQD